MTNPSDRYYALLKNTFPSITKEELSLPVRETGIDSIDLVFVRVTLEKFIGIEIPDSKWQSFKTIQEAINFCISNENSKGTINRNTKIISTIRKHEINMPHMAHSALSENWLLKEMGDIHWELLSRGLEQKSSEFKDEMGNRLYATFVRINYSLSPLNLFHENDILYLKGEIKRFGSNTYYSTVNGECNEKHIYAHLMTSFSQREFEDNSKISKTNPQEKVNYIEQLKTTPEFLNEYRLIKKGLLSDITSSNFNFKITEEVIASGQYLINPYYEINGAGLLYFASYPIITDKCLCDFLKQNQEIKNFESIYHTVYRDIFYFANCNSMDHIIFQLNSFDHLDESNLSVSSSLYRQSDNTLMARIFTIKHKVS